VVSKKQLLGSGLLWDSSSHPPTTGGTSLLLPAPSKGWRALIHASPPAVEGELEGGRCLLTRDNHCGEPQLLQTDVINVQLEDGSLNNMHFFFALELLSDHSEGPESFQQDPLLRKKRERLMRSTSKMGELTAWEKAHVLRLFSSPPQNIC